MIISVVGKLKYLPGLAFHSTEKFFETAEKNKLVFMELLFWSNPREGIEIIEGYEENGGGTTAKQKKSYWSEEVSS